MPPNIPVRKVISNAVIYIVEFVDQEQKTNLLSVIETWVEAPGWRETLENPFSAFGGSPDELGGEMYSWGICNTLVQMSCDMKFRFNDYLSARHSPRVLERERYLNPWVMKPKVHRHTVSTLCGPHYIPAT